MPGEGYGMEFEKDSKAAAEELIKTRERVINLAQKHDDFMIVIFDPEKKQAVSLGYIGFDKAPFMFIAAMEFFKKFMPKEREPQHGQKPELFTD